MLWDAITGPIRRFVELDVTAAGDGSVHFEAQVVRTEPRPMVTLLDVRVPPLADDLVRMCSWCCRSDADGWSEVEEGVLRLGIFLRSPPRRSGWRESNPHN